MIHRSAYRAYRFVEALEHGLAYQKMANVEFDDFRQRRDCLSRAVVEPVAGVNLQSQAFCPYRSGADRLPFRFSLLLAALRNGVAPGAGMQLDHRRTDARGSFDLPRRRADKERDTDAISLKLGHSRRKLRGMTDNIEAALGGALGALLRDQAGGMRLRPYGDRNHFVGCRHFEIKRLVDFRLQTRDVVITDMAAIFAQMRGNSVGARHDRKLGRAHRIGVTAAAGISDGGDMIDVDAETQMRGHFA